ncbi:uncharacterized protein [Littorina saxatilis]|uniref:uncharacterized protein n=1 Tax=Littorina saxatilis TaxID=31220 RepID=UPI0038B60A6E
MPRLKKISLQIMSLVSGPLAERPSQLNTARQERSTSASGLNAAVAEAIEEYVCSGNFKEDFHGLCLQHQMPFTPSVVPRPIPPSTQLVASAIIAKPDKKAVRRNPPHRPKSKLPDLKHSKMRASRSPSRPREDEQLSIRSRTQSFAVRKESEIRVDSSTALPLLMEGSTHGMSMENVVFRLETDNGVSNGHQAHGQSPPVHSVRASMPDTDKPPLTFSTKDKGDYFKPCIQVEQENMEDGKTVREIYIRGWKVDMAMMEVLERCLPVMPRLRLLHLWNVGLGVETLSLLASFLPQCIKLTTLVLDGNTLTGCPVSKLLGPTSRLQYLSLR